MGNKTNTRSKSSSKRSRSLSTRSNTKESSYPTPKRAKKAADADDWEPSNASDAPVAMNGVDDAIEELINIQSQVFMISHCVILGAITLHKDIDHVTLSEFKYRNFKVQIIKMVDKCKRSTTITPENLPLDLPYLILHIWAT